MAHEISEAQLLKLQADTRRLQAEILAMGGEVGLADDLVAHLDAALRQQDGLLASTRLELEQALGEAEQAREAAVMLRQEAAEQRALLQQEQALVVSLQARFSEAQQLLAAQSDEFHASTAKLAQAREVEAHAFGERRAVWETTINEWLREGHNKRIDPILYNVNKPVYELLRELLVEEAARSNQLMECFQQTLANELRGVRASLEARARDAEEARASLASMRSDFATELRSVLSAHLRGELERKQARVAALEKEIRNAQAMVREAKAAHGRKQEQRLERLAQLVRPLVEESGSVSIKVEQHIGGRKALLEADDPRHVLERATQEADAAQARVRESSAAQGRMAQELQVERDHRLRLEARVHELEGDIVKRSLQFGEKEYYQRSVSQLEEQTRLTASEVDAVRSTMEERLEAQQQQTAALQGEVSQLREQRTAMAASLSHYAALEVGRHIRVGLAS